MIYNSKKILFLGTLMYCLCFVGSFLVAQSSLLSVSSVVSSLNDSLQNVTLKNVDGPYLIKEKNQYKLLKVIPDATHFRITEEVIDLEKNSSFQVVVDNKDQDTFSVPINPKIQPPKAKYKQPEKLLAISDIEGNFNAFYSLLLANAVIDTNYNWTYGNGHLVLIGDFMDRGDNVTPVLWLIYKLEQAAKEHGGMVHFILGNHEILNLNGVTNYVDHKYIKIAQKYSGKIDKKAAYKNFMSDNQELVRWMKSKNTIEKIGNTLFVHGGISPQLVSSGLKIDEINSIIRRRLKNGVANNSYDKLDEEFLLNSLGPLWFRGLAIPYRNHYKKSSSREVYKAVRYFKVDHIAIGHTIASQVSLDFDGRVIRTDVKHSKTKGAAGTQGLLITNNQLFRVNAKGEKTLL